MDKNFQYCYNTKTHDIFRSIEFDSAKNDFKHWNDIRNIRQEWNMVDSFIEGKPIGYAEFGN